MMRATLTNRGSSRSPWTVALLMVLGAFSDRTANAQFGYGFGFGWGGNQSSGITEMLDQRNLQNAARTRPPAGGYGQARRPYWENMTDRGSLNRSDISSGLSPASRYVPRTRTRSQSEALASAAAAAAATSAAATPAVKPPADLSEFFNKDDRFTWPKDASTVGALESKRAEAEAAVVSLTQAKKASGQVSIAAAAEARNKLIAYGQEALQVVQDEASRQVSENFHSFLMALYESLESAAAAPSPSPAPRP